MKTCISFLLFVLIITTSFSFSQENVQEKIPCNKQSSTPNCDEGWLTIGIGSNSRFDFAGVISANFGRELFWEVKLYSATNLCISSCPNALGLTSLSVSRGYSFVDRVGRVAFSAGPTLFLGRKTYDENQFVTTGLVTNAQFIVTPFKDFGIGLDFFGNLNPKLSTYGISLTLVIEGHK